MMMHNCFNVSCTNEVDAKTNWDNTVDGHTNWDN